MATSVHLPKPFLDAVARKARALGISRNQLVIRALERELGEGTDWSPGFFDQLEKADPDLSAAMNELARAAKKARR